MAYSRDDIDLVRERTDLVELAAEVTKVKRSGRSTMAVCPFHSEKTPSLSIDGARGLYHCFGCGKSGDVFKWVQETQSVDFTGALELLARRAGVTLTIDPAAAKRRNERERLVEATSIAVEFYMDRLKAASDAGSARSYLRSRGYDGDVVDQFSLGYSPDDWEELVRHLRDRGIRDDTMQKAGLASGTRRGGVVDRFRGRIMFPIFDLRGDPVGFGARILDGDGPKYLNTPETTIYHKSRLLYGLNWAKADIAKKNQVVVCEGYTDVIGFHRAGVPRAVATCGTALTEEHVRLLKRYASRVVLAFDADAAGQGAAERFYEWEQKHAVEVSVARLPPGKDPGDLAQSDPDALQAAVEDSIPFLGFRLQRTLSSRATDSPEHRARLAEEAMAVVNEHPNPTVRKLYAGEVATKVGLPVSDMVRLAERGVKRPAIQVQTRRSRGPMENAEFAALVLLVQEWDEIAPWLVEALFEDDANRMAFIALAETAGALE